MAGSLFEPFLVWVNEELARATGLALFQARPNNVIWAKFVCNPGMAAGATKVIPFKATPDVSQAHERRS